jgi:formylglycine-generating enzyme required for sulfatase activity/uncharacterized caspase-like protein
MLRAAFIVFLIALLPSHSRAEARIALLIGNQTYNPKVGPLKNPHDDIALLGAALRSLGFTVTEMTDADYRSMDAAIKRHAAAVRREGQGTISLLYYSGHGAADPDTKTNYLIPIDVADADDADLWNYSLNLNNIIEGLRAQAPAATHYVVFDACRNELNLTRKGKKALTDKGFVPLAYTPGVMVAYATAPGQTAADTGGGGGPYAKALADEIVKPGIEAMTMFRRVALRVNREIGQDPWMSASTLPEVYFAGQLKAPTVWPSAQTPSSEAAEAWDRTKDTTSVALLEAFIARYKDTYYGDLARARIEDIKKRQVAIATPPLPPTRPAVAGAERPGRQEMLWTFPADPTLPVQRCESGGVSVRAPDAWVYCWRYGVTKEQIDAYLTLVYTPIYGPPAHPADSNVIVVRPMSAYCQGFEIGNERKCLRPKDTFKECSTCPEMVVVPNGSFTMGSPEGEPNKLLNSAESPQHEVTISKPFAVGRYAITRGEFATFVRETNHAAGDKCRTYEDGKWEKQEERAGRSFRNPGFAQDDQHPVVCVNWDDAKAFATWLSHKTSKPYRLLTEAEREYVTRAGSKTRYSFGNDEKSLCKHGNVLDHTAKRSMKGIDIWPFADCDDGYAYTAPVGHFAANAFGIHDTHGNVWDWTEDCWHENYQGAPTDSSAWTSGDCSKRVIRGGAWRDFPLNLRSASRLAGDVRDHDNDQGFRLARTLAP